MADAYIHLSLLHKGGVSLPWLLDKSEAYIVNLIRRTNRILGEAEDHDE